MKSPAGKRASENGLRDLDLEQVCFVIIKARELTIEDAAVTGDGSNPSDDNAASAYSRRAGASFRHEIIAFIDAMNEDEQNELVALYWIGRGDFGPGDLEAAIAQARDRHERRAAAYLLSKPLLAHHLEEALAQLRLSCEDVEKGHL